MISNNDANSGFDTRNPESCFSSDRVVMLTFLAFCHVDVTAAPITPTVLVFVPILVVLLEYIP